MKPTGSTSKKVLAMSLALSVALALAGCSGSDAEAGGESQASAESSEEIRTEEGSPGRPDASQVSGDLSEGDDEGSEFADRTGILEGENIGISDEVGSQISMAVAGMQATYRDGPYGGQSLVHERDWSIYTSRIAKDALHSPREIAFYDRLDELARGYISGAELNGWKHECDSGDYYATDGVKYSDLGLEKDQAQAVLYWFCFTSPQYYFLRGSSLSTQQMLYPCLYEFASDGVERAKITNELFDKLDGWIQTVDNGAATTYQKELLANNLICETVSYDHDSLLDGREEELRRNQSLYSAVMREKTVCAGYSKTFCAMMSALGVDAMAGLSETHAWNVVRFDDGNYYAVDVCWNDTDKASPPYNNRFLNVGDADLRAQDNAKESHIYSGMGGGFPPALAKDSYVPTDYDTSTARDTSSAAKDTPAAAEVDMPQNVRTTGVAATSFQLAWDPVEGIEQYEYALFKDAEFKEQWTDLKRTANHGTGYSDTNGGEYYFGIRAVKTVEGQDYYSDWVHLTVPAAIGVEVPQNVRVTDVDATSFHLAWDAVEGIEQYEYALFKDAEYKERWGDLKRIANQRTGYKNTNGGEYYFGIRAVKTVEGQDYCSDWVYLTVPAAAD